MPAGSCPRWRPLLRVDLLARRAAAGWRRTAVARRACVRAATLADLDSADTSQNEQIVNVPSSPDSPSSVSSMR